MRGEGCGGGGDGEEQQEAYGVRGAVHGQDAAAVAEEGHQEQPGLDRDGDRRDRLLVHGAGRDQDGRGGDR